MSRRVPGAESPLRRRPSGPSPVFQPGAYEIKYLTRSSWVFLLQKHPHLQVDAGAGQVALKDPAAESPARGPGRARAAAVCGSLCEAGSSPRAPIPVTWGSGALLIRAGGLRSTAEKDRLPAAFVALLCHPVANLRPQHAPRPPQPPPFQVFP